MGDVALVGGMQAASGSSGPVQESEAVHRQIGAYAVVHMAGGAGSSGGSADAGEMGITAADFKDHDPGDQGSDDDGEAQHEDSHETQEDQDEDAEHAESVGFNRAQPVYFFLETCLHVEMVHYISQSARGTPHVCRARDAARVPRAARTYARGGRQGRADEVVSGHRPDLLGKSRCFRAWGWKEGEGL